MDKPNAKRTATAALCIAVCAALISCSLASPAPRAFAVTSAEKQAEADEIRQSVDAYQTMLNEANAELARATGAHEAASAAEEDAAARLDEAEREVADLQGQLAQCARGMYKNGGSVTVLDVVLGASSFDDFIALWDSFERVSGREAALVEASKAARAEADAAKTEMEEQRAAAADEAAKAEAARDGISAAKAELDSELARVTEEVVALTAKEEAERLEKEEAEQRARQAEEAARQATGGGSAAATVSGWTHPCPSAPVTNEFGWAGAWDGEFHNGIDLGAAEGTPILAAAPGTVEYVGDYGSGGNAVIVSHGGGVRTIYMHMSRQAATAGQQVSAGDVIGYVGTTGYSTGPHLHFQVEVNHVPVNPRNFVSF